MQAKLEINAETWYEYQEKYGKQGVRGEDTN